MDRQALLNSISITISDYRQNEIATITPEHVGRWVCQFDEADQNIILSELDRIFKKYYLSLLKIQAILEQLLLSQPIFGENPLSRMSSVDFLDIQTKGNSQKELLKLLGDIAYSKYGITIKTNNSSSSSYVYLDDCLFSGNRAFYDLKNWLETSQSDKILHIIGLVRYSSAKNRIKKDLIPIAKQKNIEVKLWKKYEFKNLHWESEQYECLWASQNSTDPFVETFVKLVKENAENKKVSPRLFRPQSPTCKETLFSSVENRQIVEKAFLEKGAYICSLSKVRQPSMRPMGYEYLESLGFGSMFVTYRNIANNCPLVLWWGDPNARSSHPFSKWYPLFPRKNNEGISFDDRIIEF